MSRPMSPEREKELEELEKVMFYWEEAHDDKRIARDHGGHPLNVYRTIVEKFGKSKGLESLRMYVGDLVERHSMARGERLSALDREMSAAGVLTMSALRRRYWKKYESIVKRGKIRSEAEFYLIKGVADGMSDKLAEDEVRLLNTLIRDYEDRLRKKIGGRSRTP